MRIRTRVLALVAGTFLVAAPATLGNGAASGARPCKSRHCRDRTPPTVTVTAPTGGSTVSGTTMLGADASDNVGVTQVQWYVDNTQVAADTDGAPWTKPWNSAGVSDGSHRLFAKAADAAGNWGTSQTISFTVSNSVVSNSPCGTRSGPPATYQHVVWIVFENKAYSEVIGSSSAPYINTLANGCGLATNFHAEAHPSLPNYIAMTSGSTQGITDDDPPSSHPLSVPSIFSQTTASWRSLEESMPSNCAASSSGSYAVKHNPAPYYTNIRTECASLDVPLADPPDVSAKFTFVTPNLCDDMHDCSVATGDAWLSTWLPKILSSAAYTSGSTAIFITWDEDDSTGGQHIPTIVVSPYTAPGTTSATLYNHYAMLRTTEELLGITTYLGNAATAPSMRAAFGL